METFALVAMFWLMGAHGGDFVDMRVPSPTETACKARAREFQRPYGSARCEIEGRPETFTLVVWHHAGMRLVEEARMAGLTQAECTARAEEVRTEILKTRKRVCCLREPTIPRDDYESADCGLPVTPGRKPV